MIRGRADRRATQLRACKVRTASAVNVLVAQNNLLGIFDKMS
jgi:hypothetical protein